MSQAKQIAKRMDARKKRTKLAEGSTIYSCPRSPDKVKLHVWLLIEDESRISDSEMEFEFSVVCKYCSREEGFHGAIMDWKQMDRYNNGDAPGEQATEQDDEEDADHL